MGRNEDPPLNQGDLLRQEGARTEPMPRGAGGAGGNNDVGGGGNNNGGGRPSFTTAGAVLPIPNVATNNAQQAQGAGGNGPAQGGAAGMAGGGSTSSDHAYSATSSCTKMVWARLRHNRDGAKGHNTRLCRPRTGFTTGCSGGHR